jgi:hypothetical protein
MSFGLELMNEIQVQTIELRSHQSRSWDCRPQQYPGTGLKPLSIVLDPNRIKYEHNLTLTMLKHISEEPTMKTPFDLMKTKLDDEPGKLLAWNKPKYTSSLPPQYQQSSPGISLSHTSTNKNLTLTRPSSQHREVAIKRIRKEDSKRRLKVQRRSCTDQEGGGPKSEFVTTATSQDIGRSA